MLTTLLSHWRRLALVWLLVLITCTGCLGAIDFGEAAPVKLSIRQVQATGRPGVYTVAGNTTLPEQTQITVAALRDFQTAAAHPVYAILDRQFAKVQQGRWQASLNLWQVAPDGQFQEGWQLSDLSSADPATTVTFLATLDPANQPPGLKERIEAQDEASQVNLVRFTTDGELYLEDSEQVNVPLPSGRTTPPAVASPLAPRTSGRPVEASGDRNQDWSQTSAPLRPNQLLR